jgi:hypothetical protein
MRHCRHCDRGGAHHTRIGSTHWGCARFARSQTKAGLVSWASAQVPHRPSRHRPPSRVLDATSDASKTIASYHGSYRRNSNDPSRRIRSAAHRLVFRSAITKRCGSGFAWTAPLSRAAVIPFLPSRSSTQLHVMDRLCISLRRVKNVHRSLCPLCSSLIVAARAIQAE